MAKEIVKDIFFLKQKSAEADKSDLYIAEELLDTLKANSHRCVGMAANMIGYSKRILAFSARKSFKVMINPVIVSFSGDTYDTEESCLSLEGVRPAVRHTSITVEYLDMKMKMKKERYSGFTAQIIQHEIDHFDGIII